MLSTPGPATALSRITFGFPSKRPQARSSNPGTTCAGRLNTRSNSLAVWMHLIKGLEKSASISAYLKLRAATAASPTAQISSGTSFRPITSLARFQAVGACRIKTICGPTFERVKAKERNRSDGAALRDRQAHFRDRSGIRARPRPVLGTRPCPALHARRAPAHCGFHRRRSN